MSYINLLQAATYDTETPIIKKYIYYLNQRHKTDIPYVITTNFHRIYEKIVVFMIVYNFSPVIKI